MENENEFLQLEDTIINTLKQIYDPEIPVNIYDLGLKYNIKVDSNNKVDIEMTLTSPNCPVAESLPVEIEKKVSSIKEVSDVHIEIVWDPPWDYYMMSEAAKLELGLIRKFLVSVYRHIYNTDNTISSNETAQFLSSLAESDGFPFTKIVLQNYYEQSDNISFNIENMKEMTEDVYRHIFQFLAKMYNYIYGK